MIYSKFYFRNNLKIPNYLLGGFILFFILFIAIIVSFKRPSSSTVRDEVRMVEVTNLSPIQATIVWQSNKKDAGSVIYGEQANVLDKVALDDRDVIEKKNIFQNHYVTIRDLKPGGTYFFKIIGNETKITNPEGKAFSFKTPFASTSKNNFNQFFSKALKANLVPESNAIVLLYIDSISPLSALTKDSGEWLIPLNSFYEKDTLIEKILSGKEKVRIEIISENNEKSTLNTYLSRLSTISETIIMAKNYNFTNDENVLSASTSISEVNQNKVDIIYPQEKALIPGRMPLIKGIAVPNKELSIILNSKKTFSAKILSNNKGEWDYLPPESLDLGLHNITIMTTDFDGKKITITRNFIIISNETTEGKVLGVASGEPTIYISPLPSLTPDITSPILVSPTTPVTGGANFSNLLLGSFSFFAVGLGLFLIF